MKRINIQVVVLVFSLILLSKNMTYAQLMIDLGPTIGYTIPANDYSGETTDFYNGTKYGLKPGINFGAMGKLNLGPVNLNLSLIYAPLSNSGVAEVDHTNNSVEVKQHLFTISIGPQFNFGMPMSPVKPYIGLDLLFTTIGGSVSFQGTQRVQTGTFDINGASRTGLGFSAGLNVKLGSTKLDLSLRYNVINLFSKSYEGSANNGRIESYRFLNDAKDPNYNGLNSSHPIGSNRSIATIQFQLGILFGI